jgi:hypothetical protein
MNVDQEALNRLVVDAFLPMVVKEHGNAGGRVIRSLMASLRKIYRCIEPQECRGKIVVFQQVDPSPPKIEGTASAVAELADLRGRTKEGFVLEITVSGRLRLWPSAGVDPAVLSQYAVVYLYDNGAEHFYAGGESRTVPNVYPGSQSLFAVPTFEELRDALIYYRGRLVRTSWCRVFRNVWFDDNRLFFREQPEATIRRSLEQCLVVSLRGSAEVRPEQNVDESHPIDIRVTFQLTNRVALVEIKWLGKSKHPNGTLATRYGSARARQGARQLADYLDANHQYAPHELARGYLVVVDGRRRGITKDSKEVLQEDGLHYLDKEITFKPKYHKTRQDFEEPFRMFAEPVCN